MIRKRKTHVPALLIRWSLIFFILLVLSAAASLAFGSRMVGMDGLMDGLFNPSVETYEANIVRKRISRTVFALLCGAALGVSGALMQSVTRNPIADPSILGVNTGASLFIVSGIAYFNINSAASYMWFALAGAIITAVFVFGIGSLGKNGATPLKLVLAGAATSAALSSLVTAVMIPRSHVMDQFRFWQVGSVGSGSWDNITLFSPFLLTGIIIAVICSPALNAMALGDEAAKGLGVRTGLIRLVSSFGAVILCGAATALAGPIGFIGLLSTHLVRLILGPDLRMVIPASALLGGVILTASDVLGRILGSPGELEVGVVTAFVGAPLLIALAIRSKVGAL
ncbi:iron chelate uptake ABC transporter family permease subunit [Salinicoccus hispanicus]|uniref:Probable heme-iron transport system permease protein IsdF n=1 Tax=Salinicoccus hispanicus TaxID=157225 RepID=A0A6N8TZ69_9STAP|nr:iron chelate uptake ABC transporter family permease subunit [Salinicoccus hispanicus]